MDHRAALPFVSHFRIVLLLLVLLAPGSCKEEPQIWKTSSEHQLIGDFIAAHPDQFSEFEKLTEIAGMHSLLKIRGPFTVFLPDNEAMKAYYSSKGAGGLGDFSEEFCVELCQNHFIANAISTGEIGLGALPYMNGLGDYLATEFDGSDIVISKSSRIIKRDVYCANGVVHGIDNVLDPVTRDIFTVVSSDPSYSIFTQGLSLTGIKDTLQIISFPFGNKDARTRFTLLAVADSIYRSHGINSVEDLIEWCKASPDSLTFIENPFYRYMEYHCLHGAYFLSDLNTGVYPILSRDNNVLFTIDSDYKINYDKDTEQYTGFIVPASNTPAKNGALHAVNDLMPPIEPTPVSVLFETTDFFDVKQGDYYLNHFQRFFDGENTFEKIKWEGDYLQYWYHFGSPNLMTADCLAIQGGWWKISVTFPKVMKGEYDIILRQPNFGEVADCAVYLDGVSTRYIYAGPGGTGEGGPQVVAHAVFETTAEHTITIRNITNGMVFWDYVIFEPAEKD